MIAATRLIHRLAGSPPVEGATANQLKPIVGVCSVCGETDAITAKADRALGANFTDRSMFTRPDSDRVCSACVAICSGMPPRTFRMWTVVATPGRPLPASAEKASAWIGQHEGLCLTSKADTRPVIDTLLDPPDGEWLVSVAESGQKHVLPYASVNHGTGSWTVRMETVNVTSTPGEFRQVIQSVATLRSLKHRMDDIAAGQPSLAAVGTQTDLEAWESAAAPIRHHINSPILNLAGWVLTKERINEHAQ